MVLEHNPSAHPQGIATSVIGIRGFALRDTPLEKGYIVVRIAIKPLHDLENSEEK